MKKRLVAAFVAAWLGGWSAEVQALGLGFYGMAGMGEVRIDPNPETSLYTQSRGFPVSPREQTDLWGAGLVFDSSVARDRLFNYRLSIGYESMTHDQKGEPQIVRDGVLTLAGYEVNEKATIKGIVIDQDFGFALHRSEGMRLWFGPELRLAYGTHHTAGIGIGPVLGLNLHTGPEVSTSLKLGYLFTDYIAGDWPDSPNEYDSESHFFINLAFLFRSPGDRF